MKDRLSEVFEKQLVLQERISKIDNKLPFPPNNLDISSKDGQFFLRELSFRMIEELCEAISNLKNKTHSQKDNRNIDQENLYEELADTFTYFVNLCLFCGLDADKLFEEYSKKNVKNNKRIDEKY